MEPLTAAVGPYFKEWAIGGCWTWTEWPGREVMFPSPTNQNIGINSWPCEVETPLPLFSNP